MPTISTLAYFVEVEHEYPASTHNQHKDYPLAPVKEKVLDAWLSEIQMDIKERFNLPQAKVSKLLQTIFYKRHYVLHFKLLQLCAQLGMRITKLHGVLKSNLEQWLEPYITLNSNLRKNATNNFQQNYYKLKNNWVYGKP